MIAESQIPNLPAAAATFGKPKIPLLAIFDRQRRQALIWFFIALAAWAWAVWDRHKILELVSRTRQVIVIDSLGTYYVSPVVDIQQAKDLHSLQTKWACKALFERNPVSWDNPELLRTLFLKDAATAAQQLFDVTKAEFQTKSLHQKLEMDPPEILSARDDAFYTAVNIQLIRVGSFAGSPITEVLRYRAQFKFVPNPDLTRNGRFPTAVASFRIDRIDKL